ncbi:MAG: 1-acyl-sn-glycerol-3-phosphate acyltransferase [Chitinophagaceae bacterium]|nr:1-acyl-sn-glycerol-3-phosphate acyltransferase [Chitinophagaceae bacterium]
MIRITKEFFTLIFRLKGWKINGVIPADLKKCVLIAAPHTSNWDFIYTLAAFNIAKVNMNYLAKKELFKFPLNILLKATGAIPVIRSKHQNLVENIIQKFKDSEELILMIPAEGTRKLVEKWKSGFYYAAIGANVPIVLGYLDYSKKVAGFGKVIYPTGDKAIDMATIKAFYKDKIGKNPQWFSPDAIKID